MHEGVRLSEESSSWSLVRSSDAPDVKGVIRQLTAKMGVRERYYQNLFALRLHNKWVVYFKIVEFSFIAKHQKIKFLV